MIIYVIEPDIVITVLSEKNGYSGNQAELLRDNVINQAKDLQIKFPRFLLTHEKRGKFEIKGAWTIHPIISILESEYGDAEWYLFCQENTVIRLERLMMVLSTFNSSAVCA